MRKFALLIAGISLSVNSASSNPFQSIFPEEDLFSERVVRTKSPAHEAICERRLVELNPPFSYTYNFVLPRGVSFADAVEELRGVVPPTIKTLSAQKKDEFSFLHVFTLPSQARFELRTATASEAVASHFLKSLGAPAWHAYMNENADTMVTNLELTQKGSGADGTPWFSGLPSSFNWQTFLSQNPALEARFIREQRLKTDKLTEVLRVKRAGWVQQIARLSMQGKEGGYAWKSGLPVGFNWKRFLAQNPSLGDRYSREQEKHGRTPSNTPNFYAARAAWLQTIALLSREGKDGLYFYANELPHHFKWHTFLDQNPYLQIRFRSENSLNSGPLKDPIHKAKFISWIQQIARLCLLGKEGGYGWLSDLPKDFNWRRLLIEKPGLAQRYIREQMAKNSSLTPEDFESQEWLAKRAYWLQRIQIVEF